MAILGLIPRVAFAGFFITAGSVLPFYLIFNFEHTIEIVNEAPVPPTPEEYLKLKADREAVVCGYSTVIHCRKVNIADQLSEIIKRESGWGGEAKNYAICNRKYGCGSGQGLIQLIVRTQKHCSEKLGREIRREDPIDSIDCGIYLLETDPGGIGHWESADGSWGSGPY